MDGRAVANFILDYCDKRGVGVSNLSLQKLLFFMHAWHLVEFREPLIKHNFEAWEYGPVLQYLYHDFKNFKKSPIKGRAKSMNRFTGKYDVANLEISEDRLRFLEKVLDFYHRIPPSQLVNMSHVEGGPWEKTWNHDGKTNPGMKISDSEIASYYSSIPRSSLQ